MKPFILFTTCAVLTATCSLLNAADETTPPSAKIGNGEEVGISRRDGITISGGAVHVTRNGVTEQLTTPLGLSNGVTITPEGVIKQEGRADATLKSTQILRFDGQLVDVPADPRVNPGDPRTGAVARQGGTASMPAGSGLAGSLGGQGNTTSSVFLGADGVPVMGTINGNGTVTLTDGTIVNPTTSGLRAVQFSADGTTSLGTIGADGSIVGSNGSVLRAAPGFNGTTGGNTNTTPNQFPQAGAQNVRPPLQNQNQQGQTQQGQNQQGFNQQQNQQNPANQSGNRGPSGTGNASGGTSGSGTSGAGTGGSGGARSGTSGGGASGTSGGASGGGSAGGSGSGGAR